MSNYPDVETLLCGWLQATLPTGGPDGFQRWLTEFPLTVFAPNNTPLVVVSRFGGADPYPGVDDCNIDVDVYTAGPDPIQARSAALARSEDIRRAIRMRLTGVTLGVNGPTVSRVRVISAPTIRPYDSRGQIRKAQAAYGIRLHGAL